MGAWRNFLRSWSQTPGIHLSTLIVLISSFCVITLCTTVVGNMKQILSRWGQSVQVTVYLKDNLNQEQVSKVQSLLTDLGEFEKIDFVSREQAAERFQKSMGSYSPKLFNDPEFGNPLPMSFEATLKNSVQSALHYANLVSLGKAIQVFEGVDEVSYGQGWVENYAGFLKSFDYGSWTLMAILLFGSVLVIGNSIRSSIHQRRDEIEILELCGATAFHIRWPYVFEGALSGGIAASLAVLITYGLFLWLKQIFGGSLFLWGIEGEVRFLTVGHILGLITLGISMGAFGSYMCVRKLASGWSAAERVHS